MFNMNSMLLMLSSLFILQGVSGDKTCSGNEVQNLDNGCTKIDKNPLVFRGNLDEKIVREKVQNIKYIVSGIEVIETELETFDYLKHVERIQNSNGPAMLFKKNKNLKRLNFTSLGELKGKDKQKVRNSNIFNQNLLFQDIVFENDHFAQAFSKEADSFDDFMKLELIARKSNLRSKACSNEFYQFINQKESSDSKKTWTIIMIIAGVIFTIMDLFFTWIFVKECCARRKNKAKKRNKVKENVPVDTTTPSASTTPSGSTTPSATSTPSGSTTSIASTAPPATIETPRDK
ncbi:hypothetical protein CRE_17635 [Caenorhabditis remanei]|uniref:Receptor L-domain domain-containing protein n=1 Tax=Caenorhabditis remanei TaxID=31234 RepID=E3NJP6_CAERE|nr:hypothetical protein CRE_17635 [Caenorhabditis remanei]